MSVYLHVVVMEVCNVCVEAAGGLMEPVSDGLPAHWLRVFVTSHCEFHLQHLCCFHLKVLKLTAGLPEAALWQWSVCRQRWRCPGRTSCCHSWRRWAAPAATRSRTPLLPSASLGWSTSDHRVSLMQEQVLRDKKRTWSCQMETYDLSFFCRWLSRQSDSEHDEESV